MTEMVERVARAMCQHFNIDPDQVGTDLRVQITATGEIPAWQHLRDEAMVAIAAMREPTNEMMKAVWEARFDYTYNGSQAPAAHAMCVAMIDAALKPKEGGSAD